MANAGEGGWVEVEEDKRGMSDKDKNAIKIHLKIKKKKRRKSCHMLPTDKPCRHNVT